MVSLFMDGAVSVDVQWESGKEKWLALSQTLASIDCPAIGERVEEEEPLLSHTSITDWAPQQEMLAFDLDTEKMTTSLPAREMQELLPEWPRRISRRQYGRFSYLEGSYTSRRM